MQIIIRVYVYLNENNYKGEINIYIIARFVYNGITKNGGRNNVLQTF